MSATESKLLPAPPRLMASLLQGFDAITMHISLILFPLTFDLFLWLGPKFKLKGLFDQIIAWMISLPKTEAPETAEMLRVNQEGLSLLGGRLNLFAALRTYPIGIPSLMASRMPLATPKGLIASGWEAPSFLAALGGLLLLALVGYLLGAIYFSAVADASVLKRVRWYSILRGWPWASIQTILLTLVWIALIIVVSVPASCMISFASLTSPGLAKFLIFLYAGFLIWLLLPLFFSPHGIFVHQMNAFTSLKRSVFLVRITLPSTGIFFIAAFVISQGLDLLWSVPGENSWLTLIGITGHAFVTTGLLAASFVYYKDADHWMQSLQNQWEKNKP